MVFRFQIFIPVKILQYFISSLTKFLLIVFLLDATSATAQRAKTHTMTTGEAKEVKKDANTLFGSANYNAALKGYLELVKTDPNNAEFNYRIGYCYLVTNVDKKKALSYLETASSKDKTPRKEMSYFYGVAYMYLDRWDDAIKSFDDYKTSTHSKPVKDFPAVERQIEMCTNAKELAAHPLNVTFENLGKAINSPFQDYNPFMSADGKSLVFTSRRKGNMGGFIEELGMYSADVFFSTWKDTAWTKAKSVGAGVNSEWDEESVGLSADGNQVMLYLDNLEAFGDLAAATLKGKTWQKYVLLGLPVNTKNPETAACMTLDGSTIYFASERKDAIGGSDIYMTKRKEGGEWGPVVNLGATINTKEDEDAPFISMDGKTLYFSSKGHMTMGGFDVFRSTFNESSGTWSKPENIGYPVNTTDDDLFFSMTGDQRHACVSALREGGFGDKDIYKITYNDTIDHPFLTLFSGKITPSAGGKVELTKATLTSKSGDQGAMIYKPTSPDNEFLFAAKPGTYSLSIEGYNFQTYKEDITIENEFPPKQIFKTISVTSGK